MFFIAISEGLRDRAFYALHRWAICIVLFVMGVFLLAVGRFVNAGIRESRRGDPEAPAGPFLLVNLEYWGLMMTIFAVIVAIIIPTWRGEAVAREGRSGQPKTNVVKKVETPLTNPPVVFPELKLQGLVFREGNPSALINGRTYFVGNSIGDAKLISVTESNVTLELQGQQRRLALE